MISTVAAKALRAGKKASALHPFTTAWSENLSFSSPESDFYHSTIRQEVDPSIPAWSQSLSYASPEGDFVHLVASESPYPISSEEWLGNLSFASPETDFTADPEAPDWEEWSDQVSFCSPESDFQTAAVGNPPHVHPKFDDDSRAALQASHDIMGLAISSPESACGSMPVHQLLEDYQMYQLHEQRQEQHHVPLPRTLAEALADTDPRAIVVTEAHAPFHVVDVNDAWVGLCGYSKEEARQHHSLQMLQGPGTNPRAVNSMLDQLVHGNEADTLVTNYTKMGRKFYNHLRAGPLYDESNEKITHFVGVLDEVTEQPEYFHVAQQHA